MKFNNDDRIAEYMSYDPETGHVKWIKQAALRTQVGQLVGSLGSQGRWVVQFRGKAFTLSRVAWFLHTGKWPTGVIDHKNGDTFDDRWCNLREITIQENNQNCIRINRTGFMGVRELVGGKFAAYIKINGDTKKLGVFGSSAEAHAAYKKAKEQFHAGYLPERSDLFSQGGYKLKKADLIKNKVAQDLEEFLKL